MTDDLEGREEAQPFDEDDLEDDELDEDEREDEREAERAASAPPGRRPGHGAPTGMGGPRRAGGTVTTTRTTRSRGLAIDPSLRIRDRVSEAFVIGTLAIFGAILVGTLAFGHGGAFTVVPTPRPTVNITPAPSGSVSPSGSPEASPSGSPEASPSAAPSAGASPAPSST